MKARRNNPEMDEDQAAVKIQARWKGHHTRKQMKKKKKAKKSEMS